MQENEICDGLTFAQHAESVAMWELHGYAGPNYQEYVKELTDALIDDLNYDLAVLQPYEKE